MNPEFTGMPLRPPQTAATPPTSTTAVPSVRTLASEEIYVAKPNSLSLSRLLEYFTFEKHSLCVVRELGYKERENLLKIAEITKEGFLLKQQLIQEAMRGVDERKVGAAGKRLRCSKIFKSRMPLHWGFV